MDEKALFMRHWKNEASATRKVLARVPDEKSDYRPHPASRTARELATLIVVEERALLAALETGRFDWAEPRALPSMKDVIALYDRDHDETTRRLDALDVANWEAHIPTFVGGHEVMNETGHAHAWVLLFDQIHHRGQLSTYLRPMGAKVPSIYGPSGDEMS
ncbi:MAG TPA: DinB family protein [Thermoanaerobaculia bacterium]|nr:DinB family protein [Thermoanaerobaculia bacterium]